MASVLRRCTHRIRAGKTTRRCRQVARFRSVDGRHEWCIYHRPMGYTVRFPIPYDDEVEEVVGKI